MLAVVLVFAASPVGVALGRMQSDEPASPAVGHAEVVAQGVAAMPAVQVAWRVVTDTAEPAQDAQYEERALGFALADADGIVISDATLGTQARLGPGEASFVGDGVLQHRGSVGDQAVSYIRIALVPAEAAQDDGGDTLVYGGGAFAGPADGGGYDLNLVRDVLQPEERTQLPESDYRMLLLVTSGRIAVFPGGVDSTPLGAGEAGEFASGFEIQALGDEEATFVAALIGPAVPAAPAPPQAEAPTAGTGSVSLASYFCPEGMTRETLVEAECELVDGGFDWMLGNQDGSIRRRIADASGDGQPYYTWDGLPYADYSLLSTAEPDGYGLDYVIPGAEAMGQGVWQIAIEADQASVQLDAYFFFITATPGEDGIMTLEIRACPEGALPSSYEPSTCELIGEGFDVRLVRTDDESERTLADAVGQDGVYTWNLPLGLYLVYPEVPAGYDLYDIPDADGGGVQGPFQLNLTEDATERFAEVYFFPPSGNPGTVAVVAYDCPHTDSEVEACRINGSVLLDDLSLLDAEGNALPQRLHGPNWVWGEPEGLPVGTYSLILGGIPDGYDLLRVEGAVDDADGDPLTWTIEVSEANPQVLAYVLLVAAEADDGIGTVTVAAFDCPGPDPGEDCYSGGDLEFGPRLFDPDGNQLTPSIHGYNGVYGEGGTLPAGTYSLELDVPDGYAVASVDGATDDGDGDPTTWEVMVTEAAPNATVQVHLEWEG